MTTFLWIMLGGIALGFIGFIVFLATKKRLGIILSLALTIACIIFFAVDISVNPIKNQDLVSQSAQELDFAEMVSEYRTNEVRAKDTYKDNRYEISAEVVGIEQAGLREGIEIAKAEGKYKGRKPIAVTDRFLGAARSWQEGSLPLKDAIEQSGLSESTFFRKCKQQGIRRVGV